MIQKLSKSTTYSKCVAGAPVVIVLASRKEKLPAAPMVPIDMGIALENIWLEADALGLGGVCIGVSPIQEWMDNIHQILDLPDNLAVFSLFALGYSDENRTQQDRFDQDRIHFVE